MTDSPKPSPLAWAIEEVHRQSAAMRMRGLEPVRIRLSKMQMTSILTDPAMGPLVPNKEGYPPSFCGLPYVVDDQWDGPLAVESAEDMRARRAGAWLPR